MCIYNVLLTLLVIRKINIFGKKTTYYYSYDNNVLKYPYYVNSYK